MRESFHLALTPILLTAGFGNHVESEAIPDTLPKLGNAPQKVANGLYAEQVSGTAFTAPRHKNQRSWLYRVRVPHLCLSLSLFSYSSFMIPFFLSQKLTKYLLFCYSD